MPTLAEAAPAIGRMLEEALGPVELKAWSHLVKDEIFNGLTLEQQYLAVDALVQTIRGNTLLTSLRSIDGDDNFTTGLDGDWQQF